MQVRGAEPDVVHQQVILRIGFVEEQRPERVDHKLQVRMREFRKDRLAIHTEENRGSIADENKRRVIVERNGLYRLRLRGVGDYPLERNVEGWRQECPEELIDLCRSCRVLRRKISVQDSHVRHENHMSVRIDLSCAFKRSGTDD